MARRLYDTPAWQRLRRLKLTMDPLCEQCRRERRTTPAREVDHIVPISQGGEPLDLANLQSLCSSCHSRKTRRDTGDSDKPMKGATLDGLPTDPSHPWYGGTDDHGNLPAEDRAGKAQKS